MYFFPTTFIKLARISQTYKNWFSEILMVIRWDVE